MFQHRLKMMEIYVKESHCWIWKVCLSYLTKLKTRPSWILQLQKDTTYFITTVHQRLSAREPKMPGRKGSRTGSNTEGASFSTCQRKIFEDICPWDSGFTQRQKRNNNNKIKTSGKCHTAAVWLLRQQPQGPSLGGLKHRLRQSSGISWWYLKNKTVTSGRC